MKNKTLILVTTIILIVLLCLVAGYWYFKISKNVKSEAISEVKAIEIMQNRFPELKDYPSDKLPPKSIKAEKADDGWYVAFVQEGSGVQIIDARCYWVKNDNSVMQKDYTPQDNTFIGDFSAKECTLVGNLLGGDRDEHGCIGSAGYSWCEVKQKCLRIWEEPCEGNDGSPICALENCHGLDINCGSNPPDVCTEIYMVGDKCLKYAKCGIKDGKCQQILNSQFTQCKACVQACINANENDNIKLFECEGKCK
jgi:hypothetical protein